MATGDITELLVKVAAGDRHAETQLMPLVYDELRRLAVRFMRTERQGHTLQPTAVVHEAYLRLFGAKESPWQGRAHFFAAASKLMRNILVDHARAVRASKRGGGRLHVDLDKTFIAVQGRSVQVLEVDEALQRLQEWDPRLARIVELRFFAGMLHEEIAAVLGISERTVKREWSVAKAWLRGELATGGENGDRGSMDAN